MAATTERRLESLARWIDEQRHGKRREMEEYGEQLTLDALRWTGRLEGRWSRTCGCRRENLRRPSSSSGWSSISAAGRRRR